MDERLYEAAIRGDVQKLLHMLNEDANMQAAEPFLDRVMRECSGKDNPLHLGALFGHDEFVREISSRKPEFARQLNSKGLTPLHLAAERGHVQVVKVLLRIDADVCFVRDRDGRIPLHLAVTKGRVEVIEELVKAKNIIALLLTDEREPILHLCAKHDQFDGLKKLVSLVGDDEFVRLKDSNDNTILHLLSAKKHTGPSSVLLAVFGKMTIRTPVQNKITQQGSPSHGPKITRQGVPLLQQHRVCFILGDNIRNYCRQTPILSNVYVAGFDILNKHCLVFSDVVLWFFYIYHRLWLVGICGSYHCLCHVLFGCIRWPQHKRLLL